MTSLPFVSFTREFLTIAGHGFGCQVTAATESSGLDGDPIFFNLSEAPIENLDAFCSVVFSGHLPFRLWGVPRHTTYGDDGRLVSAVDLHTGSRLFFEVYPDVISMYLYPGSCGN